MFPRLRRHTPSPSPQHIAVTDPGHLGFDYTLRLSRRKTAAIEIKRGQVIVAAPHRTPHTELHRWIEEKAIWIRQKLEQQTERQAEVPNRQYQKGESWPYLGDSLKLKIVEGSRLEVQRHAHTLVISLSSRSKKTQQEQVKSALQGWYRQQALQLLTQKTQHVSQQLGRQCRSIRLRRTRSKWGHCTNRGDIQYNWLIVQAPEWVLDYLVVHECCHLVHHNHSAAFWALVEDLLPNYRQAKLWLRESGHHLML